MSSTVIQIDQFRQNLVTLAETSGPYPFLTLVEDYLDVVPQDDQLRAKAIAHLVEQNLHAVAADLARRCPGTSPSGPEIQRLASGLADYAYVSQIDWAQTDNRFAANLQALRLRSERDARLSERLEQIWVKLARELTPYRAADGNLLVRGVRSDGRGIWIPAALDFDGSAEDPGDTSHFKGKALAPWLLDGVGAGLFIPRLHKATHHLIMDYGPFLYVVEENERALALALRLSDWATALSDHRIMLFTGPGAWDDWHQTLLNNDPLAAPGTITSLTRWPGSPPSCAHERVEALGRVRDARCVRMRRKAESLYAVRDRRFWARRFLSADDTNPLRVLCYTTRYSTFLQYSMHDLQQALERAGVTARMLIEETPGAHISDSTMLETITRFEPDLVIAIDWHRHQMPCLFVENVPFVCWIQDALPQMFQAGLGAQLGPLDFTMGYGLTRAVLDCGYPEERFLPCRIPISASKFSTCADAGTSDPELRCDVAYVSHQSETVPDLHARLRRELSQSARTLFDGFYDQYRDFMAGPAFNAAYDLKEMLHKVEERLGMAVTSDEGQAQFIDTCIRPLADRSLRHATLQWIADWADDSERSLHIHGRGWESHPRLRRFARGEARHGDHLAAIARGAAINLHCGMASLLHQRVLETVAAGGFIMMRHAPMNCFTDEHAGVRRYLEKHGVTGPVSIPVSELPKASREALRRRCESSGRAVPDRLDIDESYLIEHRNRSREERHYYANLAFPDLDAITFGDPQMWRARADAYLNATEERQALAARMSSAVHELFTYDALARELIDFVRDGLTL